MPPLQNRDLDLVFPDRIVCRTGGRDRIPEKWHFGNMQFFIVLLVSHLCSANGTQWTPDRAATARGDYFCDLADLYSATDSASNDLNIGLYRRGMAHRFALVAASADRLEPESRDYPLRASLRLGRRDCGR